MSVCKNLKFGQESEVVNKPEDLMSAKMVDPSYLLEGVILYTTKD